MLQTGDAAPMFDLVSDAGDVVRSDSFRGERVIVYFYPKADTPGCTKQACAIQDLGPQIRDSGVRVVGISPDPPEELAKFRAKYGLEFLLLSDPDHIAAEAYGAWGEKNRQGKVSMGIIRSSFLIDEEGRIEQTWYSVAPLDTVPNALAAV